jgi:hypothetical protein
MSLNSSHEVLDGRLPAFLYPQWPYYARLQDLKQVQIHIQSCYTHNGLGNAYVSTQPSEFILQSRRKYNICRIGEAQTVDFGTAIERQAQPREADVSGSNLEAPPGHHTTLNPNTMFRTPHSRSTKGPNLNMNVIQDLRVQGTDLVAW